MIMPMGRIGRFRRARPQKPDGERRRCRGLALRARFGGRRRRAGRTACARSRWSPSRGDLALEAADVLVLGLELLHDAGRGPRGPSGRTRACPPSRGGTSLNASYAEQELVDFVAVLNTVPDDIGTPCDCASTVSLTRSCASTFARVGTWTVIGVSDTIAAMSLKPTVCTSAGSAPMPSGPKREKGLVRVDDAVDVLPRVPSAPAGSGGSARAATGEIASRGFGRALEWRRSTRGGGVSPARDALVGLAETAWRERGSAGVLVLRGRLFDADGADGVARDVLGFLAGNGVRPFDLAVAFALALPSGSFCPSPSIGRGLHRLACGLRLRLRLRLCSAWRPSLVPCF